MTSRNSTSREQGRHPNIVWGFPAGKPQVFADTARDLSKGIMVYGFGRRMPRLLHVALASLMRIPMMRLAVAETLPEPAPVCGWSAWDVIKDEVQRRNDQGSLRWIHFRSQWSKARSNMLGLTAQGTPHCFLVIDTFGDMPARASSCGSFRVPEHIATFSYQRWSVRRVRTVAELSSAGKMGSRHDAAGRRGRVCRPRAGVTSPRRHSRSLASHAR